MVGGCGWLAWLDNSTWCEAGTRPGAQASDTSPATPELEMESQCGHRFKLGYRFQCISTRRRLNTLCDGPPVVWRRSCGLSGGLAAWDGRRPFGLNAGRFPSVRFAPNGPVPRDWSRLGFPRVRAKLRGRAARRGWRGRWPDESRCGERIPSSVSTAIRGLRFACLLAANLLAGCPSSGRSLARDPATGEPSTGRDARRGDPAAGFGGRVPRGGRSPLSARSSRAFCSRRCTTEASGVRSPRALPPSAERGRSRTRARAGTLSSASS